MKNKIFFFLMILFFPFIFHAMAEVLPPLVILSPSPLFKIEREKNIQYTYLENVKKWAAPLSAYFYYINYKNSFLSEFRKNPYSTTLLCLYISYATGYFHKEKDPLYQEIKFLMQDLFYIIIIAQGIYNSLTKQEGIHYKFATFALPSLITLQEFLYSAYQTWSILFTYYQEQYKTYYWYAYPTDKLGLFEVIQAGKAYEDLLPLITDFYDKHSTHTVYEALLENLAYKLKSINHRIKKTLHFPNQ